MVIENEIRSDIGLHLISSSVVQIAWFGRETNNLFDCITKSVFTDSETGDQFFVMFFREFIEIVGQNFCGKLLSWSMVTLRLELEQQALLQIACADTGRLQFMNHFEHFLQFVLIGFNPQTKGNVIGNRTQVSTQIPIVIDASDQVFG